MARQKSRRRANTSPNDITARANVFFEALPATLPSPSASLPEVRKHISDVADLAQNRIHNLKRRIDSFKFDDWWQFQQLTRLQFALWLERVWARSVVIAFAARDSLVRASR
jgi:hypothetical protein